MPPCEQPALRSHSRGDFVSKATFGVGNGGGGRDTGTAGLRADTLAPRGADAETLTVTVTWGGHVQPGRRGGDGQRVPRT